MTVSRAFQPNSKIAKKTREAVLEIADRVGYSPDPMVTELMSSFAGRRDLTYRETLAALWWPGRWASRNSEGSYSNHLWVGLNASAKEHGCRIEHHQVSEDQSQDHLDRILKVRGIRGVILTPPPSSPANPPALDWSRFSCVTIGSSLIQPDLHRAEPSHFKSFCKVLREVQLLNFRNPCLLLDQDLEERMSRAYTGAFSAWEDSTSIRIYHQSWRAAAPDLSPWLRQHKPDLIIGDTMNWLRVIPEEFSQTAFVSMDTPLPDGPVSGIYQNTANIAESAIDLLIQLRHRNETGIPEYPRSLLSIGKWVEGKSIHGLNTLPKSIWIHSKRDLQDTATADSLKPAHLPPSAS
tara:strand:- start:1210 stop:2262 length:1053 start_codon:yes stop_codon:yes gene_type:complete